MYVTGTTESDVGHLAELIPRLLDRVEVGHVGHRAAGVEVGQDHLLVGRGQHVGRLGHEVDPAEHHELGLARRREAGQPERVAPSVGPAHHLVPLVVVAEDHQARPEGRLGRRRYGAPDPRLLPTCSPRGAGPGAEAWNGTSGRRNLDTVGGDSPVAHPRGCRPRGGYVAGYRAGLAYQHRTPTRGRVRCRFVTPVRQTRRVLQRPPTGTIPDAPGSYQFRDRDGRVIYVGKAKSLRSRLSNYFQNPANLPPRTAQMVAHGRDRRVDPGAQRRRGAHARVQLDQAAQAALQRTAAGTTRATRSWRSRRATSGPGPW